MERPGTASYFLGANSARGFYSLYDDFIRPEEGDFLWVIKGGPGCGKSSFMRRIGAAAEEEGHAVEYARCSGDPESLDGVYIPALRTAYVDGTPPHAIEPAYPGAGGMYLDLGTFCDVGALRPRLGEIAELNRAYKAMYKRAYALLAGAGALAAGEEPRLGKTVEAVAHRAEALAKRELKRRGCKGDARRRFVQAISCRGVVSLGRTLSEGCERAYILDDGLGLAHVFLGVVAEVAAERGYRALLCPSPLRPERLEAVLLPEKGLCFAAEGVMCGAEPPAVRHIRLDAAPDAELRRELRPSVRERAGLRNEMTHAAISELTRAKELHDGLESIYNPHMDFEGIYALAARHTELLLG